MQSMKIDVSAPSTPDTAVDRIATLDVSVELHLQNTSDDDLREIRLYLASDARVSAVVAIDGDDYPYRRLFSALSGFEQIVVLPTYPLRPQEQTQFNIHYQLPVQRQGRGSPLVVASSKEILLQGTWFPSTTPLTDEQGYLESLPRFDLELNVTHRATDSANHSANHSATVVSSGDPGDPNSGEPGTGENSRWSFRQNSTTATAVALALGDYYRLDLLRSGLHVELYGLDTSGNDPDAEPRPASEEFTYYEFEQLTPSLQTCIDLFVRTLRQNESWFGVLPRSSVRILVTATVTRPRAWPHLLLLPRHLATRNPTQFEETAICTEACRTWFGYGVHAAGPAAHDWLNEGLPLWLAALHLQAQRGVEWETALLSEWRTTLFDLDLEPLPLLSLRPYQSRLTREGALKGALIFNELRKRIGQRHLIDAIRRWFRASRLGNSTLAEFESALQQFTDIDLTVVLDQWLRTTHLPNTVIESWHSESSSRGTLIYVALRNNGRGEGLVTVVASDAHGTREEFWIDVPAQKQSSVVLRLPFEVARLQVDPDGVDLNGVRWKSQLALVKRLRREGKTEPALEILQRVLAHDSSLSEVWYQLGRLRHDQKDYVPALEAYQSADQYSAGSWIGAWSWYRRAEVWHQEGRPNDAREALDRVDALPGNPFGIREQASKLRAQLGDDTNSKSGARK